MSSTSSTSSTSTSTSSHPCLLARAICPPSPPSPAFAVSRPSNLPLAAPGPPPTHSCLRGPSQPPGPISILLSGYCSREVDVYCADSPSLAYPLPLLLPCLPSCHPNSTYMDTQYRVQRGLTRKEKEQFRTLTSTDLSEILEEAPTPTPLALSLSLSLHCTLPHRPREKHLVCVGCSQLFRLASHTYNQ